MTKKALKNLLSLVRDPPILNPDPRTPSFQMRLTPLLLTAIHRLLLIIILIDAWPLHV